MKNCEGIAFGFEAVAKYSMKYVLIKAGSETL